MFASERSVTHVFLVLSALVLGTFTMIPRSASAKEPPRIGTERGELYPDFYLPRLDGSSGRLSEHRGTKLILFHFASW